MNKQKLNNEQEFKDWCRSNISDFPIVIEGGGELVPPRNYPCTIVYAFIEEPYFECAEEEEDFASFIEEGFCSDEIELLKYHYVYPSDFNN